MYFNDFVLITPLYIHERAQRALKTNARKKEADFTDSSKTFFYQHTSMPSSPRSNMPKIADYHLEITISVKHPARFG